MLDDLKGYKVSPMGNLTHLLYMDDIKLFAQNDAGLQKMVDLVQMFSDDIKMSFGINKCAKLSVKRGKLVSTGPVLTIGDEISELAYGETYRYLGFPEAGGVDHAKCKQTISAEFQRRLRLVWKSLLHGRFKVQATNGFCVPLLSYGFGIVDWTMAELSHFDVLTRRIMTAANSHHPRSAIERLYLPRHMGGRGLVNVEHLYQRRVLMLAQHLRVSCDPLVKECHDLISQMPSRRSLLSRATAFASDLGLDDISNLSSGQLKSTVCSAQREKLITTLCAKPLHGKFFNYIRSDNVHATRSFYWLKYSLHSESESSIFAVQDQVLCTRVYQAKIMRSPVPSLLCRLCHEHEETIQHVLAGCPVLASTSYLHRHNMVARVVHWHLCKTFDFPLSANSWFSHQPLPVIENDDVKILWDFGLSTHMQVSCNRPDIVVFLKMCHRILFVEISCPCDVNVFEKEDEKVSKYQVLAREMSICYNQPVQVIPVIFGHSGVVSSRQLQYLKKLPCYCDGLFQQLQQAALLGTISILRDINFNYGVT